MLYHNFPIVAVDRLKLFALECVGDVAEGRDVIVRKVRLPEDILNDINQQMVGYGLPLIGKKAVIFKRSSFTKPLADVRTLHIDFSGVYGDVYHASIVIPVSGCENTYMYWVDGKYETAARDIPTRPDLPSLNSTHQSLVWKDTPRVIAECEIVVPTLCRVDVPHDAYNGTNEQSRITITLRFEGNPSFDDIITTRFGKK